MKETFFRKMAGLTQSPPRVSRAEVFWSWLGSFWGIAAVAYLNEGLLENTDLVLIIGSFGASAVLIYGAIKSPLAQPRNLLGGSYHFGLYRGIGLEAAVFSALVGRFPGSICQYCCHAPD